jgi:hypothetical protein
MSLNNNTNRSRPAAVRALRRLSKAEALTQLVERPDLAANISAAARLWGASRATVRAWLAEYAAMAVPAEPPPAAMATPPAATDAAMAAPEVFKAALCHLADLIETTTPQEILDSADPIELLGLHQDCELVAAYVGAIEILAGAALRRAR